MSHAVFGASGPDASSPKKKPAKPKPVQATAASTKPAPAKAAPAKAASAKTGSTKQSKAKAAAAAEANAWMDVIAAGGRTLKEHAERSAGLGPASGKAPTSKPAKGASASQDQPVNRSRLRQSYEQARKADVQTTNDDDDIPSLCSTNSNASDYDDDDGASDGDDESVESIDVTVPPGRTLWPPQAPAPQAKPKSTASAAPNATAGNRPSAGAPPKPVPEPLFREEPRGPLAGLYQARAASVAKASAERKAANFMKGAFDKPKAAGSKSSKAESGQDVSSQGFKGIFAAQPKSKVMADADSGAPC